MKKSTLVFLLGFTTGALATVLTSRHFRTATGHLDLREGTRKKPLDYSLKEPDLSGALSEEGAPPTIKEPRESFMVGGLYSNYES